MCTYCCVPRWQALTFFCWRLRCIVPTTGKTRWTTAVDAITREAHTPFNDDVGCHSGSKPFLTTIVVAVVARRSRCIHISIYP